MGRSDSRRNACLHLVSISLLLLIWSVVVNGMTMESGGSSLSKIHPSIRSNPAASDYFVYPFSPPKVQNLLRVKFIGITSAIEITCPQYLIFRKPLELSKMDGFSCRGPGRVSSANISIWIMQARIPMIMNFAGPVLFLRAFEPKLKRRFIV